MKNDTVDPAALLLAVVTIAVTVLTNEGPWDPMNTVLALVILTVLWGCALARRERRRTISATEGVAVAIWIRRSSAAAEPPAPDPLQRLTDEVVRLREALERRPVPAAAQPAEAVRAAADKVPPRPLLVTLAGEIRRWRQTRNMVP